VGAGEGLVTDVAGAILDGAPVDWLSAESTADEIERPLIQELKLLATLAKLHRQPSAPHAQPLHQWGHLKVLDRIGRGAFGEVFRAWDTRLDREVALKLLPATSAGATSIIEEGRLLARVRHPNVVTIYGAERIDGKVGLWMELVKGRTLEQVLDQGKTFDAPDLINIGAELCEAVKAVHGAGLLHRDIKCHNVMLADDGRVVLMDFGTGLELDADASGGVAGTPLYLAPEVLRGGEATVRSDIYSVGITLYHLATGSYPVRGRNLETLRQSHEHGDRTDLRAARPELPPKLARVIDRAIDPRPDQRYQNVQALAADLEKLKPRRSPVPWMAAVGAAAAIVIAILLGSARRNGNGSPPNSLPVIAVLPFVNLSSEPESDLFVDGLSGEIIRNLSEIDGLQTVSRTSSFYFKGKPRNLRDIGTQLGARLMVEGEVLRSGNHLRVNAKLVQVAGDVPLWAEKYDRELKDVFAVLDEISLAIVNQLRLKLGPGQRRYDTTTDAYVTYLKARALAERAGSDPAKKAIELFEQVTEASPNFAPGHAGLAIAWAFASMNTYFGRPISEAHPRMREAAKRALELDPGLAEAHWAQGWVQARDLDWNAASNAFKRAIQLNPTLTGIYTSYSISTLCPLQRFDEALQLLQKAERNDPASPILLREIGMVHLLEGRYDAAIDALTRARALDGQEFFATVLLGRSLLFANRTGEGIAILHDSRLFPAMPDYLEKPTGNSGFIAHAYVGLGRRSEVERMLVANKGYAYREALINTALGSRDAAFEALDRLAKLEPQRVPLTTVEPELAALRDDPRLKALRRQFNLPE